MQDFEFCEQEDTPYSLFMMQDKARDPIVVPLEKVEQALQKLERQGTISPITHSDWAAPIVPVLKQNGDVRICGDYWVIVNQAVKIDSYPLT